MEAEEANMPNNVQVDNLVTTSLRGSTQTFKVSSVRENIQPLDRSAIAVLDQEKVRSLLLKHRIVLSEDEGDLGCTNLIS